MNFFYKIDIYNSYKGQIYANIELTESKTAKNKIRQLSKCSATVGDQNISKAFE